MPPQQWFPPGMPPQGMGGPQQQQQGYGQMPPQQQQGYGQMPPQQGMRPGMPSQQQQVCCFLPSTPAHVCSLAQLDASTSCVSLHIGNSAPLHLRTPPHVCRPPRIRTSPTLMSAPTARFRGLRSSVPAPRLCIYSRLRLCFLHHSIPAPAQMGGAPPGMQQGYGQMPPQGMGGPRPF